MFIEKIHTAKGVKINHMLGRQYVQQVESAFVECRGGHVPYTVGDIYFFQNGSSVLGVSFARSENKNPRKHSGDWVSPQRRYRYAVLTNDGKVLPDPEYCGEISGGEDNLREFLSRLLTDYTPLYPFTDSRWLFLE